MARGLLGRRGWLRGVGVSSAALSAGFSAGFSTGLIGQLARAGEPAPEKSKKSNKKKASKRKPKKSAKPEGDGDEQEKPAGKRVLLVGDSMIAGALGLYLERGLRDEHGYVTHRRGKTSSGLARPDFFDWIEEAQRQNEEFPEADAAIAMFGGAQGLRMPERKWIRWHEPGWSEEYARRVNAFADAIAPNNRQMFFIGMPVMGRERLHARVQRINTIYRAEMAIRPNAKFIDIWRVLSDERGEYTDRVKIDGKRRRVRAGDGVHLNQTGARIAEKHVRAVVHQILSASA